MRGFADLAILIGVLSGLCWQGTARAQQPLADPPAPQEAPREVEPPPVPALRPKLSIISATPNKSGAFSIEVEVSSPSGAPVRLQPLLNGQAISGYSVAQSRGLTMANRYTLTLALPATEGMLQLLAEAGEVRSEPAMLRLHAGAVERRPALYLLSVGVSNYKDQDIPRLRYPGKDARDLAMTLQRQRGTLYRETVAKVLADDGATRALVLDGLDWLQKSVTKDDMAVVFLAGHGTNDTDGRYYYLPYDARADNDSMLSGQAIQTALRGIAGRVVLMLDTCHSGNVLGRSSLSRLINDLTTENRIVVFAASTGDQTARESAAWQNGAFTKAIVEGLRGVADYAEDGRISMSELETWAGVRVRQLTADAQTPTLAKPNAAPDYMLAALPLTGVLPNPKQVVRRRSVAAAGGVLGGVILIAVVAAVTQSIVTEQNRNIANLSFH